MNKSEALSQFVEQNFQRLVSNDFSRRDFKALEKAFFFDKHANRFGRYKMNDVLPPLVRFLRKRGVEFTNICAYMGELPVFGDAGEALIADLRKSIEESQSVPGIRLEDLETIRQTSAFEAVKIHRRREVEAQLNESLSDLTKEIESKRAEYEALPSILDKVVLEEPSFDPEIEHIKPWWERFYLKQDPFAQKDGLSNIDKTLYEEVLVKTLPFRQILSSLHKNPEYLFRSGFLLSGGYGYGKTTFIDYLSYFLIQKGVLPVRITCGKPFPDSDGFVTHFYLKLRNVLKNEFEKITSEKTLFLQDLEIEEQVRTLAVRILKDRRPGMVIFLDDYHKHRTHFSHIYEFLGILQILKDDLNRAEINVGFIVSGLPEWRNELAQNSQMSGFLDSPMIEMPDITPELVQDVFNQRIETFCYDQSPRRIKVEFIRRMFSEIEGKAGLRDYLNRIISELSGNNLSIVNTPIEIDDTGLTRIRTILESDPIVKSSLTDLALRSKFERYTQEQIAKCFELLIQVALQEGISEEDKLFTDNKFYFLRLSEVGLIQKGRFRGIRGNNGESSPGRGKLVWIVRTNLQKKFEQISTELGLGANDYLLKLYGWTNQDRESPALDQVLPSELVEFQNYFARPDLKLSKSAISNISLAFRLFEAVLQKEGGARPGERLEKARTAFERLSAAYFEIDGSAVLFHEAGFVSLEQRWQLHYLDDEGILEMFQRLGDYSTERAQIKFNLAFKQVNDMFFSLARKLMDLIDDAKLASVANYGGLISRSSRHSPEELKIFKEIREAFNSLNSEEHFDYVKRLTDHLEIKLRLFLYVTTVLAFGDKYPNFLPEATKQYAHKSLTSRNNYTLFVNGYNGFTRPQFRSIFLDGNKVKELIITQLDIGWTSDDWQNFFTTFVRENIATSHQQQQSYSHMDKNRYAAYVRMSEELCVAINALVRDIPLRQSWIIGESIGDVRDPASYIFKHPFKLALPKADEPKRKLVTQHDEKIFGALDKPLFHAHKLPNLSYQRVIDLVEQKIAVSTTQCLIEDLLGVEYITNNYDVSFEDFLESINYAHHVRKRVTIHPWFGSSIVIRKTSKAH